MPTTTTFLKENKRIIFIFTIWWIAINGFAFLSFTRFSNFNSSVVSRQNPCLMALSDPFYKSIRESDFFIRMHVKEQSWQHLAIVEHGYKNISVESRCTDLVHFPLYPLLIRYLGNIFSIDYMVMGLLISNISIFLSVLIFYKLARFDQKEEVAERSVFYLLIFPTAFYFTMLYTESLFLLLSLLVFYFALKRKWLLVGIIGFFASLTRITGIFLFLPLIIEYFHQEKKLKPSISFLTLIPAGLASFLTFHHFLTNDFFAFLKAQQNWNRNFFDFGHVFDSLTSPRPHVVVTSYLELIVIVVVLIACISGFKRLRTSYFIYLLLSILIPVSSGILEGIPRYMSVVFPLFLLFTKLGDKPYFDRLYTLASILLLAFVITLRMFTR